MFFKQKNKARPQPREQLPPPTEANEPSYLGRDMVIEGQISCEGELHIDGSFRGNLRARVCVVDLHGVVHGELSGEIIHVRGRVIGPIQGSKVYIHAGAHVEGDVFQDSISIENGAYVYGTIRHNAGSPAVNQTFPPHNVPVASPMAEPVPEPSKPELSIEGTKTELQNLRMVHSRE
jgi:cytoskeletal protein CcmA (bactofilin family)